MKERKWNEIGQEKKKEREGKKKKKKIKFFLLLAWYRERNWKWKFKKVKIIKEINKKKFAPKCIKSHAIILWDKNNKWHVLSFSPA